MWPVPVVMLREDVKDALKMLVVQDQQPVETRGAPTSHKGHARLFGRRVLSAHFGEQPGASKIPVANHRQP